MKILFLTTHAYLPQRAGGSESSTNNLCQLLGDKGHDVAVIANLNRSGRIWIQNRVKSKVFQKIAPEDYVNGYPVFRTWDFDGGLLEAVNNFKPDCVVTQAGESIPIVEKLCGMGIKTLMYVRDVDFESHGGTYFTNPNLSYISNSNFTANRLKETFGIDSEVIPPIVPRNQYLTDVNPLNVLFVCPYKKKGLDIALKLADMNRDIPFIFLESWPLKPDSIAEIKAFAEKFGNIKLMPPQQSMKSVYASTKIALVPSQCEEAWGRIATECQISGIPVIANSIGGLPESAGNGGLLLSHENFDINEWQEGLRRLWDNHDEYEKYSRLAVERSKRKEIQPEFLINKMEKTLENAIASSR